MYCNTSEATMEVIMQKKFKKFYRFFQEKTLCDVNLICNDGKQIAAHKIILASASRVFYTMFTGPFKEGKENGILIKEIDFEILEMMVKFAYTFELDIKENNCEKLLMAANMYGQKYIIELCFKYIKENINPTNCVRFMKNSKLISDKKINNFCWSYFLNNFNTILNWDPKLETLHDLEFDDVVEFIAHDDLVIDTEEKIFNFIIGWIRYNPDERNDLLPVLMKHLRLPLLSKEGLQRIYNEPLVINNKDIMRDMLENIINTYNSSKPPYTLGRNTHQVVSSNIIFAIFGHSNSCDSFINHMDIRNKDDLKWKSSDHLFFCPPHKDTTIVLSENGIILAIGWNGNESDNCTNSIDELDLKLKSKQWVSTRPLNQPRKWFAFCTYNQYIYVVGGCDFSEHHYLNSVEYYDTKSKVWTEIIEPMPTARRSCCAEIYNNKLYVFGGYNGVSLATVECYDFEKKYWKQCDPMPIRNHDIGISRIENVIYLIGGNNACRRVFKFDLQHFKWDEMPNMNMGIHEANSSVVIEKDDLFVFVNDYGVLYCEQFDAEENKWKLVDRIGQLSFYSGHIITFNDVTLKSYVNTLDELHCERYEIGKNTASGCQTG